MPSEEDKKTLDVAAELAKIEAIVDEKKQARALTEISSELRKRDDMLRALKIAQTLRNNETRAKILASLVPVISEDLLPAALQFAQSIQGEKPKAIAQSAIVMRLQSREEWAKRIAKFTANVESGSWLPILLSFLVASLVTVILGWFVYKLMPGLWNWGYGEFSWRYFVAWVPIFYLGIVPLIGLTLFPTLLEFWREYGAIRKQVTSAREAQERIEQELLKDDPQKLVLIISYSRQMLSEYYGIAMSQAKRSFHYCLIAMWLGFFVLLIGVLDYFIPIRPLITGNFGTASSGVAILEGAANSPNDLVLITGVVIEFIAAAFLWVYRFSIQQQTYYYRRQLRLHNTLLAQRLSESIVESKDKVVEMIVRQLLEDSVLQQMEGPNTTTLGQFLKKK